ncbi:cellulase family glycosylhydrolase [Streptacidiphilus carbonis]|uniref:cellulase family glycosylhydrolase n=1 Tax=Streptacidiphilus carbonis TaxID=105422 RepID=UPI000A06AEE1|nr:cellulase family glycosylhydrolase [Streptacidiphilus carbonis]
MASNSPSSPPSAASPPTPLRRSRSRSRSRRRAAAAATALALAAALLAGAQVGGATRSSAAGAATPLWFDTATADQVVVATDASGAPVLRDGYGREVVLRGFNVSGETKLAENGYLPFASRADADIAATAMRRLTGADLIRLAVSWAGAEPTPAGVDTAYLASLADQIRAFTSRGIRVLIDYHQDLYSRALFNQGSWYTGDGAPAWVVAAGGYPTESCGVCVSWGQNYLTNAAVTDALHDFWHNRTLTTSAGSVGVQTAFLDQAQASMTYLRTHLAASDFARIVGVDPFNEPSAGSYDSGQTSTTWERDLLWPFYQRFRAAMDTAGWQSKTAWAEPLAFWNVNVNVGGTSQPGGFPLVSSLGSGYVFNTHYYDAKALSGILMLGKAADGQYSSTFAGFRQRAAALGSPLAVTEFGYPLTGYTSDKGPSVEKATYQALDSTATGAAWWGAAANGATTGTVLSGTQWQWDVYSGRHHELMNDNPSKVETTGDGWNGEDYSIVQQSISGGVALRVDQRLVDRVYPRAVSGDALAFTYEDLSRDSGTTMRWNTVPGTMPNVAALLATGGPYAVLTWRSGSTGAPTELHLPAAFDPATTTVVSDLATLRGLPAYTATGQVADHPVAVAPDESGDGTYRLLLSTPTQPGTLHYALIAAAAPDSVPQRTAAAQELASWAGTG